MTKGGLTTPGLQVNRKGGLTMFDQSGLDPAWRPDSYLVPSDATEAFLLGVRGTRRRADIRDSLRERDLELAAALRSQPERTREELPPFILRDPERMGGEHLPVPADGEVDLVRIEFANPSRDVVCVRARARLDGWELFVVDERDRHFRPRRPWFKDRLSLGQMVGFLDQVKLESGFDGLVPGLLLEEILHERSFQKLYGDADGPLVQVTSPFYPQLGPYFEQRMRDYLVSPQFQEFLAMAGALASPDAPAREQPPARLRECAPRRELVWGGRLNRDAVVERCEPLVSGGEDHEVLAFLESQQEAVAGVPDGLSEIALIVGICCERAGRFELAQRVYQRGLSCMPSSTPVRYWLHNNAAYCLIQLGRHEAALGPCRAAIEIERGRHNAWKNYGLALAGVGQPVEAARALVRAHRLCPRDVRALAHLEDLMDAHQEVILQGVPEVLELMRGPEGGPGEGSAA